MSQSAQDMAGLKISPEMLAAVDTHSILEEFRNDFKKLGDFKGARDKHEARNFLSRLWNSDELKDAQLDSIELQERFAKKLGQLIILSVANSQLLNDQQQSLGDQQSALGDQARNILDANQRIEVQQQDLGEQQEALRKLVDDYFALKGLTAENAKQLIQIAKDVTSTKERMMASFEMERSTIFAMKSEMETSLCDQQRSFKLQNESQNDRMTKLLEDVHQGLEDGRKHLQEHLNQAATTTTELHDSMRQQLNASLANVARQAARMKWIVAVSGASYGAIVLLLLWLHFRASF